MVKECLEKEEGLGTLLRTLTDRIDRGSEARYRALKLPMRARYTPILRALGHETLTVSDIVARSLATQGAISQTVKLMEEDGLLRRAPTADGRTRTLMLTRKGQALHDRLLQHWDARFDAIANLEQEIGAPLRKILSDAIQSLDRQTFQHRIQEAEVDPTAPISE